MDARHLITELERGGMKMHAMRRLYNSMLSDGGGVSGADFIKQLEAGAGEKMLDLRRTYNSLRGGADNTVASDNNTDSEEYSDDYESSCVAALEEIKGIIADYEREVPENASVASESGSGVPSKLEGERAVTAQMQTVNQPEEASATAGKDTTGATATVEKGTTGNPEEGAVQTATGGDNPPPTEDNQMGRYMAKLKEREEARKMKNYRPLIDARRKKRAEEQLAAGQGGKRKKWSLFSW